MTWSLTKFSEAINSMPFNLALVLLLDNVKNDVVSFHYLLNWLFAMIMFLIEKESSRMYYIILILFKRFRLIITDAPEMAPLTTW